MVINIIPKKIHYCWFGTKKMPRITKKCINSWKKYCSDYEIICWNERNFNINSNQYVKEAYENKKYAFVSDYVRLWVLYNQGGIYMDTDVEVIKCLDKFLKLKSFSGFESLESIPTGIIGSEKELPIIYELLQYYDNRRFILNDGNMDLTTNVKIITDFMEKKGLQKNNKLQTIDSFTIYPKDFFCPVENITKKKDITSNTHTIHWFAGSWVPKRVKVEIFAYNLSRKILGEHISKKVLHFVNKFRNKK